MYLWFCMYVYTYIHSCHSFFRQPHTIDTYYFLCCSGTNDSFGLWLMWTQVGTCSKVLEYTSLLDSTPQRHAATIPGIKLYHLVYVYMPACAHAPHIKFKTFISRNFIRTLRCFRTPEDRYVPWVLTRWRRANIKGRNVTVAPFASISWLHVLEKTL